MSASFHGTACSTLRGVFSVNEFSADGEIVAALEHAAGENGVDAELASDRGPDRGLALVTIDEASETTFNWGSAKGC